MLNHISKETNVITKNLDLNQGEISPNSLGTKKPDFHTAQTDILNLPEINQGSHDRIFSEVGYDLSRFQ